MAKRIAASSGSPLPRVAPVKIQIFFANIFWKYFLIKLFLNKFNWPNGSPLHPTNRFNRSGSSAWSVDRFSQLAACWLRDESSSGQGRHWWRAWGWSDLFALLWGYCWQAAWPYLMRWRLYLLILHTLHRYVMWLRCQKGYCHLNCTLIPWDSLGHACLICPTVHVKLCMLLRLTKITCLHEIYTHTCLTSTGHLESACQTETQQF